ncbi:MAG: L,D-transpeptidase family protein [Rhodobacteraceae bacterium]|nr:L,D-transpeptidase family protein [Paracoccaceae bacterium]
MNFVIAGIVSLLFFAGTAAVHAKTVDDAAVYNSVVTSKQLSQEVKAFYESTNYKPVWAGKKNSNRAKALISALARAGDHGLPTRRYKAAELKKALAAARRGTNSGATEVAATIAFLAYARDLSSGILEPSRVDKEIAIAPPRRAEQGLLAAMAKSTGKGFLAALAPKTPEYKRLLEEKKHLERLIGSGDFGAPVPLAALKPNSSSKNVVAMRQRLTRMGYGKLGNSPSFDDKLKKTVQQFQLAHGLSADGVAGKGTLKVLNVSAKQRLQQVLVNLERERWLNFSRGKRYIMVNITDFTVAIYDNNKLSHQTRVVVGKGTSDRRTPEFYDEMTHMVVNPTWHVPKSIAGKEYLPMLKRDPSALAKRGLRLIARNGKTVNSANMNFSQYSAKNFPFAIKQPPGRRNALGRVKFIFPNRFNIYLHDTPSKNLFNKQVRAFSHGCVRVKDPFDLAYKLLEKQTSNPKGAFQTWLDTNREQYVNLEKPVPVYLTYRTAFFSPKGRINYRGDIYGRDKTIFNALAKAGVVLQAVQG